MRKKAFIKTQLNLYMKYRINRPAEEDQIAETLQQELEYSGCSALLCSDIVTLSSDFDKILYFCQQCHLSLVMK
jgi:hypothetical protein